MELLQQIEKTISQIHFPEHPNVLYAPQRYMLSLSGKRTRPLLTLLSAQMFIEVLTEQHFNAALAVELFHNFTLLHDDIMDKSDMRRGKPTVVKQWGVNVAILSGDAMLVKAYQHLCDSAHFEKILPLFNKTAIEVCEGQQLDVDFEEFTLIDRAQYFEMTGKKTAVLLAASLAIGALSAGASDENAKALYDFAYHLGLAFQVQDDYLDVYSDEKEFGKRVGGDIIQGKKTFLFVVACENLLAKNKDLFLQVFNNTQLSEQQKITEVKKFYALAGVEQSAAETIKTLFEKSLLFLDKVKVEESRKLPLQQFAQQLMNRKK